MPELPEVENLRRGLLKNILGQKIIGVEVRKTKLVSGKGTLRIASQKKRAKFKKELVGEKFIAIERRAKNLIFKLSNGKFILAHLKMSGQFVYKSKKSGVITSGGHPIELSETKLPNKHSHIIFTLNNGVLYYNDTRMFGYILYYPSIEQFKKENHFALYGVEPLSKEFTPEYFFNTLKDKTSKIKTVLIGQKIVTGLGNIYVDESLFEAKIHPERKANKISKIETKKLHKTIVNIIKRAIKVGGSSVATYRLLDNTRGNYAREHKVYGKYGEKCINCGKLLKKIIVQSRTTIFCQNCQV